MAGGLAALPVGRQGLPCILGAEEAEELPLLRLSPPRCVRSLHCVSRGWKASSHLLPGPLPLLAIPDTGSGGQEAGKRRAARTPAGPAAALQPGPRPAPASLPLAPLFFTLKSGTSARPGGAGEGRPGAALQGPPGFPAPRGNRGRKTPRHQGNHSPRNQNALALLSSFLPYQAKFKNTTFISDYLQSRREKRTRCFGGI